MQPIKLITNYFGQIVKFLTTEYGFGSSRHYFKRQGLLVLDKVFWESIPLIT